MEQVSLERVNFGGCNADRQRRLDSMRKLLSQNYRLALSSPENKLNKHKNSVFKGIVQQKLVDDEFWQPLKLIIDYLVHQLADSSPGVVSTELGCKTLVLP